CCLDELFPRIFPWNVGSAMVNFPTLAQPAHALGIPVLSFGVIAVAAALTYAYDAWKAHGFQRAQRTLLLLVVIFGAWAAYGEWRLSHAPAGKKVRVGYVQPNIPLTEKHAPQPPDAVYQRLLDETRELVAEQSCDIVIWPEGMFDLGLIEPKGGVLDLGVPVLIGGGAWTREGAQNGALAVTPTGGHYYAKRYLLAFGERFPFSDALGAIGIPLPGTLAAGTEVVTFDVAGVRCGVSICFEGILEETGSDLLAAGAQLHLNITEDLWYGNSSAPYQHLSLVALRALEAGIPVARVANGGVSAAIDRYGRIRDRTSLGERRAGVFEVRAAPPAGRAWTRWLGDLLPWLAPLLAVVAVMRRRLLS
ncbi:MAG: apolipoprotein N-acyltransferase, partial [Planctomycetota bacterium]